MKTLLSLGALLSLLVTTSTSRAALIAYDGFNYTSGQPVNGSGGTGWSGAWSGNNTVSTPGYTYSTLPVAGNRVTTSGGDSGSFRSFSTQNGSGTYYVSFIVQRVSGNSAGYGGISLFEGGGERLFIGQTFNQDNFGLERSGGGSPANSTTAASTFSFLVARIDFNGASSSARLYVNPTLGTEPGTAQATTANFAAFSFDNVRIQSGGGPTFGFDELRIGTTYADVAPVPEPATTALLIFAAITIVIGGVQRLRASSPKL